MSSESDFAYSLKYNTHFIVKNITGTPASVLHLEGDDPSIPEPYRSEALYVSPQKTISIFNYPINAGQTRDLLKIPGIQEADIRASLLKGVIRHKFLCGDIELVSSNIDLLQFSTKQREFLFKFGFNRGVQIDGYQLSQNAIDYIQTQVTAGSIGYLWREKIPLIGLKNGSNRMFFTPDKFINGSYLSNTFHITVEHNGKELYENIDFTIGESSGPGSGYDTLNLISMTPNNHSLLYATYAIKA
jgi:hypothetical protein